MILSIVGPPHAGMSTLGRLRAVEDQLQAMAGTLLEGGTR